MPIFSRYLYVIFCVFVLTHCSSSSGSGTPTSSTAEDDLATFTKWCGSAWDSLNATIESDKTLSLPLDCPGGGSMTGDESSIEINDCVVTSEAGTTYLGRGTYTVTESASLVTHEWDQDLIVDDSTTFSSTGSISFGIADDLIAYDFSATFSSGTYRITGIVTTNPDGTSDLTISVLKDGEVWLDGSFNDADLDALTDEEVDEACSDDDDPECDTLECANDFQCQLFADDDQTDEFETNNTECASGCCALIAEESSCDDNTIACTTDFQCQMFADDDQTDEFETDNIECADGCCAVM